jgi:hypothetical protein
LDRASQITLLSGGFDVSVLLGNGDGTFQSAMNYPVPQCIYGSLKSVSIGDLNGDADQDIVVAKYCHFGGNVLVMLGNGDGTFQNAVDYEANPWPIFVAIGDLNGDGDLDLVVRNGHAYGGQDCPVSVLLGNGDGTFQNAVSYSAGYYSGSVAIGDLNKDSNLDLAVANDASENVSVMLGNGDGAFLSTVNYQGGGFDVAIDDLNGDNNLDLAVANGDGVWVLLGNGDGSFQGAVNYNAGDGPSSSVAIGDLNEDNDLDLVVAKGENDNISILINTGFLPVLEISIDIKPDSYPNSINFKSKGKVSVAILTTDDFDAYDVDPVTCEFAGAYPLRWNMEDVDHDGDHDMLLHFKTRELVDLDLDSTEATLYGETYGGVQIIGTDSVNIVPKGNMHSKKAKK